MEPSLSNSNTRESEKLYDINGVLLNEFSGFEAVSSYHVHSDRSVHRAWSAASSVSVFPLLFFVCLDLLVLVHRSHRNLVPSVVANSVSSKREILDGAAAVRCPGKMDRRKEDACRVFFSNSDCEGQESGHLCFFFLNRVEVR